MCRFEGQCSWDNQPLGAMNIGFLLRNRIKAGRGEGKRKGSRGGRAGRKDGGKGRVEDLAGEKSSASESVEGCQDDEVLSYFWCRMIG